MTMRSRPLSIFYLITFYILLQFGWWTYVLIKLQPGKLAMWAGEGLVFFVLLSLGAFFLRRSMIKENEIARMQKNFLLSVTHELKSPLAAIKLSLQTILKHKLEKDQLDKLLQNSLHDTNRLDDLVENMLIATKIENRSYSFPKTQFNLSELIDDICQRFSINREGLNIIDFKIEPQLSLYGDKFAISLVATNLIENAIKYSDIGSTIHISLNKVREKLILKVADEGIGIPENEKENIFKRFYRIGNEETRKSKGTGLGLFIVKQVLENHRAQIHIKPNKPKGSLFEVIFQLNHTSE